MGHRHPNFLGFLGFLIVRKPIETEMLNYYYWLLHVITYKYVDMHRELLETY